MEMKVIGKENEKEKGLSDCCSKQENELDIPNGIKPGYSISFPVYQKLKRKRLQ